MKSPRVFKVRRDARFSLKAYIFDQNYEYVHEIPVTDELHNLMGKELSVFVKGRVDADGKIHIGALLRPQGW